MKIDEKKFNAAKLLFASGSTLEETADYLKIGLSTVKIIKHSETYEDYRHSIMAISAKQTQKKREEREKHSAPMVEIKPEIKQEIKQEIKPEIKPENRPESKLEQMKVISSAASAYQINRMIDLMKQQLDMLTLISNKVAFIVDELTMPVKKEG